MPKIQKIIVWIIARFVECLSLVFLIQVFYNEATTLQEMFDSREIKIILSYIFYFYFIFMYVFLSYIISFRMNQKNQSVFGYGIRNGLPFLLYFYSVCLVILGMDFISEARFFMVAVGTAIVNFLMGILSYKYTRMQKE